MDTFTRVFPYHKRIMLNVLYDTLDALGFQIEKANSERGTIIASLSRSPSERVRIACSSVYPEDGTSVQVFPEILYETEKCIAEVLLDEISATAKRIPELKDKR